jgi:hypothetical protein
MLFRIILDGLIKTISEEPICNLRACAEIRKQRMPTMRKLAGWFSKK